MSTWLSDMLSATPFGSMNLMYNQCYADSTARWYMNNPLVNNFMFTPYSFNMGLNPEFVWYQTGFNMFNNAGAWNVQQPFSPWGWYQQTTNNNSNSNTTDPEQKAENEKYTQQYTKLQNLLKGILILNDGTDEDNFLGTKLDAEIAKCAKEKTPKEKYEALKKVYEAYCKEYDIKESDIQAYLEKCSLEISIGISESKKATIHELLRQSGYKGFNVTKNTQIAVNNIDSQIKALGDPQGDLSALNISETDVLAVISAYNDTKGDLIDNVMKAVNGISDPQQRGTAESGVRSLITALISRANDLKNSRYLDEKTKENITEAIKALNVKTIGNTEYFKMAFNDLYVLTRLANARIIEKSLNNQFGFLKQGIGGFVTENTIKDLEDENIKTSGIDSLKSQINIAESTGRRRSDDINEDDTPSQQIEKLEKAGCIEKVDGAKVGEIEVYREKEGARRLLIPDEKGDFYEVEEKEGVYTKKNGAVAIKASEIKTARDKAIKEKENARKNAKNNIKLNKEVESVRLMKRKGITQGHWSGHISGFNDDLDKEINKLFVWNADCGFTQDEFNAAKKTLKSYYMSAYMALEKTRWNESTADNIEPSIRKGQHDLLGDSFEYYKYYADGSRTGQPCNDQSSCKKHGNHRRVDDFAELNTESSQTGMYVGCQYDWLFNNNFYIYIDTNEMLQKFKSFLPD